MLKKIKKVIFERFIGRLFYQTQADVFRMNALRQLIRRVNQSLVENGHCPPWIYSKGECLAFWQGMDNQSKSDGNRPQNYASKPVDIVNVLHAFWSPEVQKEDHVMELGCNAGGNLKWLDSLGFKRLSGVEINPKAIEHFRSAHPDCARRTNIIIDDIASALGAMPTKSVHVLFTMGVCMHIHPHDNGLFKEMARVCAKYICTLEPETANSNYVFARNYRRVFEKLGAVQIKSCLVTDQNYPQIRKAGLVMRLFRLSAAAE